VTSGAGIRAAALAGVAVVAVAVALAITHSSSKREDLPTPAGKWYTAFATPYTPTKSATTGKCGVVIGPKTEGVAHPVLPCGVKLYVEFDHRVVLTQVVDRGHTVPGHEFDVTQALAKLLGLQGTQKISWRFAR
jgi:3D (Asp-Asp-Asp) domain-containing protein